MGSIVEVRCGQPHKPSDLPHVAADTAKTIILLPDRSQPKEVRDAFLLQTLISLRGEGWPNDGKIIIVCSLLRNRPIFEEMGGSLFAPIYLYRFVARLLAQGSQ